MEQVIIQLTKLIVKIWNSQNSLVFSIGAHSGIITGIELVEELCEAPSRTIPVILTSSMDGTLRMHDVDTGGMLYSLDTYSPCLGLFKMKKDTFLHYSERSVHVWSLNRFHSTFTFLRNRPEILRRVAMPGAYSRILTSTNDGKFKTLIISGSIKIISPVTGTCLVTGFPIHKDVNIIDFVMDMESGTSW